MRNAAHQTRANRTITIDFHNEATYFQLLGDGKAFVECVLAFLLALGFQLLHKATCRSGGGLPRPPPYPPVRLGGITPSRVPCTTGKTGVTVLPRLLLRYPPIRTDGG